MPDGGSLRAAIVRVLVVDVALAGSGFALVEHEWTGADLGAVAARFASVSASFWRMITGRLVSSLPSASSTSPYGSWTGIVLILSSTRNSRSSVLRGTEVFRPEAVPRECSFQSGDYMQLELGPCTGWGPDGKCIQSTGELGR